MFTILSGYRMIKMFQKATVLKESSAADQILSIFKGLP